MTSRDLETPGKNDGRVTVSHACLRSEGLALRMRW